MQTIIAINPFSWTSFHGRLPLLALADIPPLADIRQRKGQYDPQQGFSTRRYPWDLGLERLASKCGAVDEHVSFLFRKHMAYTLVSGTFRQRAGLARSEARAIWSFRS
jgi:hypothetical protein